MLCVGFAPAKKKRLSKAHEKLRLGTEPLEDDEFLRYPRDSLADDQKRYGADMYRSIDVFVNGVQETKTNGHG